jgi:hypothetical protein
MGWECKAGDRRSGPVPTADRIRGFMMLAAIAVFLSNLSPEVWGKLMSTITHLAADNTRRVVDYVRPEV